MRTKMKMIYYPPLSSRVDEKTPNDYPFGGSGKVDM
jgi:hypothetical protein